MAKKTFSMYSYRLSLLVILTSYQIHGICYVSGRVVHIHRICYEPGHLKTKLE
jgi:hypothetical protein